jgi:hypothetical protein
MIVSLFFFGFVRFLVFLLVLFVSFAAIKMSLFDSRISHEVFCSSSPFGEPAREKQFEASGRDRLRLPYQNPPMSTINQLD